MSQRRIHSFGEALLNNLISFGLSYAINLAVLPVFRRELTDQQTAFWLTFLFSIVSIVRTYLLRRAFNYWHCLRESDGSTWCGGCRKFSVGPCPSRECNHR